MMKAGEIGSREHIEVMINGEKALAKTSICCQRLMPFLPPQNMRLDLPNFEKDNGAPHVTVKVIEHYWPLSPRGEHEIIDVTVELLSFIGGRSRSIQLTENWSLKMR